MKIRNTIKSIVILIAIPLLSCDIITIRKVNITGSVLFCDEGFEGSRITLHNNRFGTKEFTTGPDGSFAFENLWEGDYTITLDSDTVDYFPNEIRLTNLTHDTNIGNITTIKSYLKIIGHGQDEKLYAVSRAGDYEYIAAGSCGKDKVTDAYVVRLDRNTQEEWLQTYDEGEKDMLVSITPDSDGFAASGTSYSESTLADYLTLKTAATGECTWLKKYSTASNDVNTTVLYNNGKILTAGSTDGQASGTNDFYILRYNTDGSVYDSARYSNTGSGSESVFQDMTATDENTAYCAGYTRASTGSCIVVMKVLMGGLTQSQIFCYDDSVNETYGTDFEKFSEATAILPLPNGNLMVFGVTRSDASSQDDVLYFEIKKDSGEIVYFKRIVNYGRDTIGKPCVDAKGNVYIPGSFWINETSTAMIYKFNADGTQEWCWSIKESGFYGESAISQVLIAHDGCPFGAGYAYVSETAGYDYILIKLNADGKIKSELTGVSADE